MTSSDGRKTLLLDDIMSTKSFYDIIDVADVIVLNVGEKIKSFIEREFLVQNLFLAKPVLLSRLKPPTLTKYVKHMTTKPETNSLKNKVLELQRRVIKARLKDNQNKYFYLLVRPSFYDQSLQNFLFKELASGAYS